MIWDYKLDMNTLIIKSGLSSDFLFHSIYKVEEKDNKEDKNEYE